jgi:membrane protease YdiL (CAAX protease family)
VNALTSLVRRYPLTSFFVIAFAMTWLGWIVPDLIYTGTLISTVFTWFFLLLIAGPLLSAIIVTAITDGKAGVIALLRKFTIWRVGLGWYAVALLLMPAMALAAIYLNVLFGAPMPNADIFRSWSALLIFFAIRMVHPFDGPMQEELGWRGFALPRLQERFSPLVANLILGVIVAGWHLPLVFTGKLPAISLFATVAATILFGWIFNNTQGSVLLTLIAHAVDGVFILRNMGLNEVDATRLIWLQVAVWVVVAVVVVLIYGPTLTRKSTVPVYTKPVGQPLAVK